jgi:hypothetical protein
MDVVTGGRDCPTNSNKHTLQLNLLTVFEQEKTYLHERHFADEEITKTITKYFMHPIKVLCLIFNLRKH